MPRTREHSQATGDLADALASVSRELTIATRGGYVELRLPGKGRMPLDVVVLASPRPADVERLIQRHEQADAVPVLVADRVVPRVRERLAAAGWGWLDRSGRLRLVAGPVVIDTDVPASTREATNARPVLDTTVGLAVATALLAQPKERMSVRALVAFTGHSLGAVHQALGALREERLVDEKGLPVTPELFWEASGRWRPRRVAIQGAPSPGDARRTTQLGLGLDDLTTPGWALCDTLAANAFGAFAVVRGSFPPDFYVPDERVVRVSRRLYGDAVTYESRGATVAVPPVRWACAHRVDWAPSGRRRRRAEWPVVHPLVAALDLSIDAGRGREILDDWEPPQPYERVW